MPRAGLRIALAVPPPLLALEHIGLFPGARGWVQRRDQSSSSDGATSSRPQATPPRRCRASSGARMPLVYGAGPIGGGCRDAVEVRRERERQGARVLQPRPRALSQRDQPGWGQHGDVTRTGVHHREPAATTTSIPTSPAGSSSMSSLEEEVVGAASRRCARGRRAARPALRPRALRRPHVASRWPSRRVSTGTRRR